MKKEEFSWVMFAFFAAAAAVEFENDSEESILIKELFASYNKIICPAIDYKSPIQLKVGLIVRQLIKFDERNQVIIWNVWVRQIWNDFRLQWNATKYKLNRVVVNPRDVWLPDLYMYNNAKELYKGLDNDNEDNLFLDSNGKITWISKGILRSTCQFDVRYFPFDEQKCPLEFGSWAYSGNQINLTLEKEIGVVSLDAPNGEWLILGLPAIRKSVYYGCCPEPYPSVIYTLNVQRRSSFYLYSFIAPSFFVAMISLLAFCLPIRSDERVTLLITSLLAITLFFTLIADMTPPTPEGTPLIGRFMVATIAEMSIAISVVCFIINIGTSSTRPSMFIRTFINVYLSKFLLFGRKKNIVSIHDQKKNDETKAKFSWLKWRSRKETIVERLKPRHDGSSGARSQELFIEDVCDEQSSEAAVDLRTDYSTEFKKFMTCYVGNISAKSEAEINSFDIQFERKLIASKMDKIFHCAFLLIVLMTFVAFLTVPPELHL